MFDVITLGSSTVDVFVNTDSELLSFQSNNISEKHICFVSGSKLIINDIDFLVGGGGVNTAITFSRFGLKTAYLGCLGDDDNALKVLDLLKKEKISFVGKKTNFKTNYSIILNSIEHDRSILTYKDAGDKLVLSDYDIKKLKTKWFYASSLMGKSLVSFKKLVNFAKKNNVKTAFNISLYLAKQHSKLFPLIKDLDVLIFNKEEAQELLETRENNVSKLLDLVKDLGPKIVVITNGKEGAYCFADKKYFVKGEKIKVREATGAGDAFASAFIASLCKGNDVSDSLKIALSNSQSCIKIIGAGNGLLKYNDAKKYSKKLKVKIIK